MVFLKRVLREGNGGSISRLWGDLLRTTVVTLAAFGRHTAESSVSTAWQTGRHLLCQVAHVQICTRGCLGGDRASQSCRNSLQVALENGVDSCTGGQHLLPATRPVHGHHHLPCTPQPQPSTLIELFSWKLCIFGC